MTFFPFDASEAEIEKLSVLRTDLSTGLRYELVGWVLRATSSTVNAVAAREYASMASALDLPWSVVGSHIDTDEARRLLLALDDRKFLHVIDYMLWQGSTQEPVGPILERGRSAYTVRKEGSRRRLTHRVPEALLAAARHSVSRNDAAGKLLVQAWNKAFDLDPDDSAAYMHAVQAVEAAGIHALGIDNPEATLGSVIRVIEKDASWGLPFLREHTEAPTRDTLLHMLRSLWRGHRDRHGSEAWEGVTHSETIAAVYLALSLVGFFQAGLVQHRE